MDKTPPMLMNCAISQRRTENIRTVYNYKLVYFVIINVYWEILYVHPHVDNVCIGPLFIASLYINVYVYYFECNNSNNNNIFFVWP